MNIEYPDFIVSVFAHLAGVNTEHLKFVEWNKRTGEAYDSAEITSITRKGYTTFPSINIFLSRKGITLRLTSDRCSVARSPH